MILQADERVASGAGHCSVVRGKDEWWIAYHRRLMSETASNHRVLPVERLEFKRHRTIRPMVMTGR